MDHPFFNSTLGRIFFSVAWLAIMASHATLLRYAYGMPWYLALCDSLIWNSLFALFTIGIWYWVRFTDLERVKPFNILLNHIGASLLAVLVIIWLHRLLATLFCADLEGFSQNFEPLESGRYVVGFLYYILITLTFYLVVYIQNFREKLINESELKALVREAELNWLKLQLNPHFLFNSLNSISSLTIIAPQKAHEMINRLSELLRYSLKQKPDSMETLGDELENCKRYLEIEQIRFGNRLHYSFDCKDDVLSIKVPGMILQPLFENAIKHSVAQSEHPSTIEVIIGQKKNGVTISVTNTLPDTPPDIRGAGVGLSNIRRRLQLTYGTSSLLQTVKTDTEFKATLYFPTQNEGI